MTQRVWEMVDAAALDARLREKLFQQIESPKDRVDLGARLLNSLGMKVLVSKAYAGSTSATELEASLVRLARGAARLDRVADEVRVEYKNQTEQNLMDPGIPVSDEVDIHLAFEIGLAQRLELPWQSESLLYPRPSGVSAENIETAYKLIIKDEQGDGLVNGMIDLSSENFWEEYLRRTHPDDYEANDRLFDDMSGQLDELRSAQAEWANATPQTPLNALARKLERLADLLGVPQAEVFSGDLMSDAIYERLFNKIAYERKELSRKLTREAMAKAGL
ncbi:NEL-type E3 ubiquitin ligase domain-containing protein [Pseudomonas neuropathica]|uniref:NEL-type E3 ubiquitin ligase domain-containing protein n=1 Tax=Pseudomonas neuropathica TaxID=2730425 RepID=UPI003EBC4EF3